MTRKWVVFGWHVTVGNGSPVNDGSAALLITTPERARELGLRPRARLHSFAVADDDPRRAPAAGASPCAG
jgi:acetyl-CoA acyltransferase